MTGNLDEMILEADLLQEEKLALLIKKHIPIWIGGRTYWMTIEIPEEVAGVLKHLPTEREQTEPRLHQIKTRLSDEELDTFEMLVKASGLPQGEYIRGMVLNGCVEVTRTSLVDAQALETLTEMSAELGRIAGMIRRTVIINKEFVVLTAGGKERLELQMRELRRLQNSIQMLAEEIHGNL